MIVYDARENYIIADERGNIVESNYGGYYVSETPKGDLFITHQASNPRKDRSFVMPRGMSLADVIDLMENTSESFIRGIKGKFETIENFIEFYQKPQNYVKFAALNMSKQEAARKIA